MRPLFLKGLELYVRVGLTKSSGPDEALVEVVDTVHAGKAVGPEDVDLIVFYASSKGKPTTILSKWHLCWCIINLESVNSSSILISPKASANQKVLTIQSIISMRYKCQLCETIDQLFSLWGFYIAFSSSLLVSGLPIDTVFHYLVLSHQFLVGSSAKSVLKIEPEIHFQLQAPSWVKKGFIQSSINSTTTDTVQYLAIFLICTFWRHQSR